MTSGDIRLPASSAPLSTWIDYFTHTTRQELDRTSDEEFLRTERYQWNWFLAAVSTIGGFDFPDEAPDWFQRLLDERRAKIAEP